MSVGEELQLETEEVCGDGAEFKTVVTKWDVGEIEEDGVPAKESGCNSGKRIVAQ